MIHRALLSLSILFMAALTTASAQLQPFDPWWIVTSYATELSAGASHTCMINTCGQVQCWGRNDFGQASPPAGSFTQVTARQVFTPPGAAAPSHLPVTE